MNQMSGACNGCPGAGGEAATDSSGRDKRIFSTGCAGTKSGSNCWAMVLIRIRREYEVDRLLLREEGLARVQEGGEFKTYFSSSAVALADTREIAAQPSQRVEGLQPESLPVVRMKC
jgi:hypothetical protein